MKQTAVQDSAILNSCWKTCPVMFLSFGSTVKRHLQWPQQKIHRMTNCISCTNQEEGHRHKTPAYAISVQWVIDGISHAVTGGQRTPVSYLSMPESRSTTDIITTWYCYNSSCIPYVRSPASSSFSRTVPWCTWSLRQSLSCW